MTEVDRGAVVEVEIEDVLFPDIGVAVLKDKEIRVKSAWLGQRLKARITDEHDDYYQATAIEVVEKAPGEKEESICDHYDFCGGCSRQILSYKAQLRDKESRMENLFQSAEIGSYEFLGIEASPQPFEYRNKMEFSFGDLEKGGILQLGMHLPGKMYEVVTVNDCRLVDEDFRLILETVLDYFRNTDLKKYHVKLREGYLRHLVVRKGLNTGEILINLVTTSQRQPDLSGLCEELRQLNYEGKLVGFLQTINDNYSDAVECDELLLHYGRDYYFEELLGLKFKVTPFSFFQPNTYGAERLYETVNEFLETPEDKRIYDLYCGTGTIGQLVAHKAKEIVGIEIVEEAAEIAQENAKLNNLDNCRFIAGDVKEVLSQIDQQPDVIIIDPPRPGIHPDALERIIDYGCREVIYLSCNPKSLVRDLEEFVAGGYQIDKIKSIDMFPNTHHIENCVRLSR